MRTWVDSSGKHRVEAELVRVAGTNVLLRNSEGKQVTVPIARLSNDDRAFLRQQQSGSPSKTASSGPVGEPAKAKPVAKRFYTALLDQDFDKIKVLLTPAGQANWDAAKTLIEGLDAPDSRQSVLVRTAKVNPESAEIVDVNVTIKVRGKYLKQRLQLRWSDSQWLVAGLVRDEGDDGGGPDEREGGEEQKSETISFEGAGDDDRTGQLARRSPTSDDDEEAVEDEDE
jgi:hypothetical protein